MHLPDFVLLVIGTLAAIAAGLAVVTSNYRVARVLSWIAALAFGSLGVVWSATSEGYTLATQMIVSSVVGAIATAGLTWVLWEVRGKEATEEKKTAGVASTVSTEAPRQEAQTRRGPTLEATNGSKIDATGSIIPGDLPFQFGKADGGSTIDMPGTVVTRGENGSVTIEFGKIPVNRTFPPPTGEFSNLPNNQLRQRARAIAAGLREFQNRFEAEGRTTVTISTVLPEAKNELFKRLSEKYKSEYDTKFLNKSLSVASELVSRTTPGTQIRHPGSRMLYHKVFVGPRTALDVAEFLEMLANYPISAN